MKTKKPLLARWYAKVTLVIIALIAAYLIYDSFMAGLKEGRTMRSDEMQNKYR